MTQSKITKNAGIKVPPPPPAPNPFPIEKIPMPKKTFVFIDYPWDDINPNTNDSFAAVKGLITLTEAKGERNKISRACKLWKEQNPQMKGLPDRIFKIMVREYQDTTAAYTFWEVRVWRIQ